jgi:FkbM family methyltransferase
MLIPFSECVKILKTHNIQIKGILHIGAHECEEFVDYINNGVNPNEIDWIEANQELVNRNIQKGVRNIHCLAVDNEEGEAVFNITNNGQSSSLLSLGTHNTYYPYINVVKKIQVQKKKLTTFAKENPQIDFTKRNFWNLDIQGSELNALKSAEHLLDTADAIYSEVNIEYVYEKCGLLQDMDEFLSSKGFTRVSIVMTKEKWGDALWIRI